jgi:uncharacterized protein (TIGR03437 family)
VTEDNPAVPGEMIIIYGSGLGIVLPPLAQQSIQDGAPYSGPLLNYPSPFSASATVGGLTGNILFAGLQTGAIGVYQVVVQMPSALSTNPVTPLTIAQNIYVSNIVTVPIFAPTQTGTTGGPVAPPSSPYFRKKNPNQPRQ